MAFAGKTIIITGGGTGIGAGAALYFARAGANVVITGRTQATLTATTDAAKGASGRVLALVADASSAADWERVVAQTVSTFGGIDALINNAAMLDSSMGDLLAVSVADLQRIISINVVGPLLGAKLTLPELFKRNGVIITVSSVASIAPRTIGAGFMLYAPTKAADDAITRQLHGTYGARGVRFFGVNPAVFDTPMAHLAVTSEGALRNQGIDSVDKFGWMYNPLGAAGNPADIALVFAAMIDRSTKYQSGDCVVVVPGERSGAPITCDVAYFMKQVTSPVPGELLTAMTNIPLHNAVGEPFAAADAERVRGKMQEHNKEVIAAVTAAMTAAATAAAAAAAKK